MYRSYELRIRPNKAQEAALTAILSDCCETYNAGLQERKEAWKLQRKSVTYRMQQDQITELRKDPQFTVIAVDIQRDPLRRLDKAFKAFFRRCKSGEKAGFPRYRSRHRYDSFTFNGPRIKGTHIRIPNFGDIRFRTSQELLGVAKTAVVLRAGAKWKIRITCDIGEAPEKVVVSTSVGIDVGVASLLTTSDGYKFENPRWANQCQTRIARASQRLARKKRGSLNRLKAKEELRRAHQRASDLRKNHLHHISKWLVANYDLIAYEDLRINNMTRSASGTVEKPGTNVAQKSGLNRSILDAAWGELIFQLQYKAEYAGKYAIAVSARNTSIDCSVCGEPVPKLLKDRLHICKCGAVFDRDHNAGRNIHARGIRAAALFEGFKQCTLPTTISVGEVC